MMENNSFHSDSDNQLFQSLNLSQMSNKAKKPSETTRIYSSIALDNMARESNRQFAKFYDAPDTRKENRVAREQHTKDKPANLRGFLRHTTYVSRASSFFDDLLIEGQPSKQPNSATLPQTFLKKRASENNPNTSNCQTYQSNLKTYEKTPILDIDHIATKVRRTASFIQELKKLRNSKKKILQKEFAQDDKSKGSQINSTFFDTPTQKKRIYQTPKFEEDLGFKRRIYDNFYTPKPETQATNEIAENMEKMKRGYTPTLKTIISPLHKKISEKPSIEDFIIEKKLGGGKFGTVYRAYHPRTCSVFALKRIQKKVLQENMLIDQFIQEVKIQSFMRHQHIMELYGVFDDKDHIYMVLELMQNGNLYGELKNRGKFPEAEAAVIIKQISKGIVYMHDLGIAHRDLKPENIVISNQIYKICDFGWAALCHDRRKTCCGTFDYTAPEILQGGQYDLAVDYWGLGVIAYELMVGKPPFYHYSKRVSKDNALNVESKKISFPSHLSSAARTFIESLLRKDPSKRLCFNQILSHPFLHDVKTEDF